MPTHAEKHRSNEPERCACSGGGVTDTTSIQDVPRVAVPNSSGNSSVFRIPAMDCPNEENDIRKVLTGIEGIRSLRFELASRTLTIDGEQSAQESALQVIRHLGFEVLPIEHEQMAETPSGLGEISKALIALALAIGAEVLDFFAPDTLPFKGLGMALAAAAIAFSGFSTYRKGLAALRRGQLNMNALMGVAVTGAFLIGQWPEAAMVMALYAIAELIEARSVDRARNAIKGLLALAPETAEIRQGDGGWLETPADKVAIGALARVKPGARIPLDGRVTAGSSAVNQAPVTGESIPVDKTTGDPVFAGTINETGMLEFEVTAAANNTTLARIIHAVEAAQGTRAPTQRFVDRFAAIYTPAIFAIAVAVAIGGPWLFDWMWTQALYKALVLLVIACPCALVIATPVTVVSGLAAAARRGILIKGGVYLEEARKLRVIALDKTGTITEGKPRLVATEVLSPSDPEAKVLSWAASLAGHSDHPVSKAIAKGLNLPENGLTDFTALPGRGIEARLDGHTLILGNHRLIEDRGLCSPEIEARLAVHENQGRTATLLATEDRVLAIFAVADTIKESSREAISDLHRLGVTSVMLTGDNVATATSIARQAGIDDARGNLLPEDKLAAIEELQGRHGPTAMTGDGINDAPALARADIGVAMGAAGTDTAMEAADVVIMNDDLRRIPETIRLSRRTHAVLWQNIGLALGIKVIFLGLAVFGNATMWMAVFADMGASLLVVGNGLRMVRSR
ncbi:heavy metal translocating P-type ATPase [Dechloromonas sp. TW-R-39-2]|uniref:heavy metal translocating P-type ATPase n=1 Tax=Dechloromonas sp. TW-R-39-2 TaxID=2654218 RepID=UPI00193DF441|nr:heavy metal translocating P-type ATPase [Dechloromonas sp. TW-R-39-2]QRM20458.1 heavy metal translocating P-type ATPase [Dechloromonas sp. TW-R-39-2]